MGMLLIHKWICGHCTEAEDAVMSRNVNRGARATLTHEPLGANPRENSTEHHLGFAPWSYWQHFWNLVFLVFPPQMFYSLPLLPSPSISEADHSWQVIQQHQPLPPLSGVLSICSCLPINIQHRQPGLSFFKKYWMSAIPVGSRTAEKQHFWGSG